MKAGHTAKIPKTRVQNTKREHLYQERHEIHYYETMSGSALKKLFFNLSKSLSCTMFSRRSFQSLAVIIKRISKSICVWEGLALVGNCDLKSLNGAQCKGLVTMCDNIDGTVTVW